MRTLLVERVLDGVLGLAALLLRLAPELLLAPLGLQRLVLGQVADAALGTADRLVRQPLQSVDGTRRRRRVVGEGRARSGEGETQDGA